VNNCQCMTWCRTHEETHGGKYPPSEHHPRCPEHKPEEWAVVSLDGAGCVMHPDTVADFIEDDPESYTVSKVMLTAYQVANMKEFDGF